MHLSIRKFIVGQTPRKSCSITVPTTTKHPRPWHVAGRHVNYSEEQFSEWRVGEITAWNNCWGNGITFIIPWRALRGVESGFEREIGIEDAVRGAEGCHGDNERDRGEYQVSEEEVAGWSGCEWGGGDLYFIYVVVFVRLRRRCIRFWDLTGFGAAAWGRKLRERDADWEPERTQLGTLFADR